jgi:K+-sensing histidine kinase KdpD
MAPLLPLNMLAATRRRWTTAEQSRVTAETERLRNTLLASISHDLRSPLAVIAGASSTLCDPSMTFEPEARRSLAAQIEPLWLRRAVWDRVMRVPRLARLAS